VNPPIPPGRRKLLLAIRWYQPFWTKQRFGLRVIVLDDLHFASFVVGGRQ